MQDMENWYQKQNWQNRVRIDRRIFMNPVIVRNVKIGEGVPKICAPIVGVTKEEIINEAKTFENIPVDVVEWQIGRAHV